MGLNIEKVDWITNAVRSDGTQVSSLSGVSFLYPWKGLDILVKRFAPTDMHVVIGERERKAWW